jgi:hypothetical protein
MVVWNWVGMKWFPIGTKLAMKVVSSASLIHLNPFLLIVKIVMQQYTFILPYIP